MGFQVPANIPNLMCFPLIQWHKIKGLEQNIVYTHWNCGKDWETETRSLPWYWTNSLLSEKTTKQIYKQQR